MYPKSFPKDMPQWQAYQDEFNAKQDTKSYLDSPLMVPEDAIIKQQAPIQSVPNNPVQDNIADDEAAIMPTVLGQGVPTGEEYQANFDKTMAGVPDQDLPAPKIDPREALLEEFRRMRQSDDQALREARDSDRMLALGGAVGDSLATILNARSQMNVKAPGVQVQQGAGLANTLKNFQTAGQTEDDIKRRREDLLAQYKAMAEGDSIELQRRKTTAYEKQVNAQADKNLGQSQAKPSFEEKEVLKNKLKEQFQVNKENRKLKEELEPALATVDEQIKNAEAALALMNDSKVGTGPIDQYMSYLTPEGQLLRKAIGNISLDTLVQKFQGMSRAIDTETDRKFFQETQPNMANFDTTNKKMISDILERLKGIKARSEKKLKEIDKGGDKVEAQPTQKKIPPVGSIIRNKAGDAFRVIDEDGNLEEVK